MPLETPMMNLIHAYMETLETGKAHPPNIVDISNSDEVTWAFASRNHPTHGVYQEWDSFGSRPLGFGGANGFRMIFEPLGDPSQSLGMTGGRDVRFYLRSFLPARAVQKGTSAWHRLLGTDY
jgi:hypothetical protein